MREHRVHQIDPGFDHQTFCIPFDAIRQGGERTVTALIAR